MIHHATRATRHLIFWSLVLAAIALSSIRLVLKGIESYKANLETRMSVMVGTPVHLGGLGANMRGISPELVLKNVNIASKLATAPPAIQFKEIRLGIDLGELLVSRDLLASSWVTLVGAKLAVIHKQDGQFVIEGLKAGEGEPLWLLQGRRYEVLQSQVTWHDQQQGEKPFVLDAVNLALINNNNKHRINMMANLPETYGDSLKMVLAFEGDVSKLSDIKGNVFVQGKNIKLQSLMSAYLPFDIKLTAGSVDFKIWGQWQGAQITSIQVDAQMHSGVFISKNKETFPIESLDTQFVWRSKGQQWFANINRFLLETPENSLKTPQKWPDAIVDISGEMADKEGVKAIRLFSKQLDLAEVAKLAHFFAPLSEEQARLLKQMQFKGMLTDFAFYAEPQAKSLAVAGRFDSISFEPVLSLPGIQNMSGLIKGSDAQGAVSFFTQDTKLNAPVLFDKPLPLNKLEGLLNWRQTQDQWLLASPSIILDCPAFRSESRLWLSLPKTEASPFIDLQTSLKSDDMSRIKNYLPTKVLKPIIKDWLEPAFVSGKIIRGDVLFYGNTANVPFADGSGVLEAILDIDKLELNFNPEWLHISEARGKLSYERNNIIGAFNSGKIGKVDILNAQALIPQLGSNEERLFIKGEAAGEIGEVLKALQQSPLAKRLAPVTKATTAQGNAKVAVDLIIPLWTGQELKADGNVQLKNNQLTINQLDLNINKITGVLRFSKEGIYSDVIKAYAFGKPIAINIDQGNRETSIHVDGNASVRDLENLFGWTPSKIAEGAADYALNLELPTSDSDDPILIKIKSNLEGVALQLPGNLSKTKDQNMPSSVTVDLSEENVLPIELDYNNDLKAAVLLSNNGHKVTAGSILVGSGFVMQPKQAGIALEINLDPLPLQDWLGLANTETANIQSFDLHTIKVHSQAAYLNKTRLGLFDLTLKKHKPNAWSGEIDSAIAKGNIQLPGEMAGVSPVVLNMDMLSLTAIKQIGTENASEKTSFKPLLNIKSKKTLWKSHDLGKLIVETQRTPNGMDITKLELIGEDGKLTAKGNWRETGAKSISLLKGKLELNKADQFFDKLNITKDLTETSGLIDFKFHWNSTPWQPSLSDISGALDVKFKSGRILSIEPGFGRVLGILAVAQWIKRLQLDFGDIYKEGLSYNSIEGHFDLLNGKANTKDLTIDAVPAKITLIGETDIINQTVDHEIKVVPKSLDAVPIAGTIVSRIAAMVGKTLTGKDQEGFFFGKQYQVKGKWDDIKISSQQDQDGLFHKTWNNLTDFPWEESK